jgi:hypothetical protein
MKLGTGNNLRESFCEAVCLLRGQFPELQSLLFLCWDGMADTCFAPCVAGLQESHGGGAARAPRREGRL